MKSSIDELDITYLIQVLEYADAYANGMNTANKSVNELYANRRMVQRMTCKHGNLVLESDDCLLCSREVMF